VRCRHPSRSFVLVPVLLLSFSPSFLCNCRLLPMRVVSPTRPRFCPVSGASSKLKKPRPAPPSASVRRPRASLLFGGFFCSSSLPFMSVGVSARKRLFVKRDLEFYPVYDASPPIRRSPPRSFFALLFSCPSTPSPRDSFILWRGFFFVPLMLEMRHARGGQVSPAPRR